MNNIKNFDDFNGYVLERVAYDNVLNEKSSLNKGIRGFINRRAARKVRVELEEEIEFSKSIMNGIQEGLEKLNENFDVIRKDIKEDENSDSRGEKQKALDEIMQIIEESRKKTWDINELIDDGEIDYAGFTGGIGIASLAYFGIIFAPIRATYLIHKGYNYFFNIIKNTIRKSLVMLQLNFDQFENLIIAKGFQSADYWQDRRDMDKANEIIGQMYAMMFNEKTGIMKNQRGFKEAEKAWSKTVDAIKLKMQQNKVVRASESALNCLDQYNNTYTKSLEALRTYSGDDMQKNLDAIKTSMSKLAGQDVDLQTYSDLIIASAEEHAYKVSSSIYNRFSKMTEVFCLPNQKKLIKLIQDATAEEQEAADKRKNEIDKENELKLKDADKVKFEKDGSDIFKSIDGVTLGEFDDEKRTYESSGTEATKWTYDEFEKLKKEDQDTFESWLSAHQEVLERCDETLQVSIYSIYNDGYHEYIDSLIDDIAPNLNEKVNEVYILNFDEFVFEAVKVSKEKTTEEKLDKKINRATTSDELIKSLYLDGDGKKKESDIRNIDYVISVLKSFESESDPDKKKKFDWIKDLKDEKTSIEKELSLKGSKTYYISFEKVNDSEIDYLKKIYDEHPDIPDTAFKVIGKKLKNESFIKHRKDLIEVIRKAIKSREPENVSNIMYNLLKKCISKLDSIRNFDYNFEDFKDKNEKSEK